MSNVPADRVRIIHPTNPGEAIGWLANLYLGGYQFSVAPGVDNKQVISYVEWDEEPATEGNT